MKKALLSAASFAVCLMAAFGAAACGEEKVPATLTGITLGGEYETRYNVGEKFDPAGLVVTAHYSDGTEEQVTDYTYSPTAALTAENVAVTVTYRDKTAEERIAVGVALTESEVRAQFEEKTFTDGTNSIGYRVRMPDHTDRPVPLVLFLHGAAQRGDDNDAQLDLAVLKTYSSYKCEMYDSVVIAPQCPRNKRWVEVDWTYGLYSVDQIPESVQLKLTAQLLEEYIGQDYVDASRVYIFGLSMGGFGTWDMLTRHGDLFAAGIPICGGADPTKAEQLAEIPIYTFHGTADTNITVEGTVTVVEAIERQGKGLIHYVEYQGAGHVIWDQALAFQGDDRNPPTLKWLFEQKKIK